MVVARKDLAAVPAPRIGMLQTVWCKILLYSKKKVV